MLGQKADNTTEERGLASLRQSFDPRLAKVNEEAEERPLKENIMRKRIRGVAIVSAHEQVGLQRRDMLKCGWCQRAGRDVLSEVGGALLRDIEQRALPLRRDSRRGIVSRSDPPRINEIDLCLRFRRPIAKTLASTAAKNGRRAMALTDGVPIKR